MASLARCHYEPASSHRNSAPGARAATIRAIPSPLDRPGRRFDRTRLLLSGFADHGATRASDAHQDDDSAPCRQPRQRARRHRTNVPGAAFLLVFLGFLGDLLARAEGRPWLLTFLTVGAWLTLFVITAVGLIPLAAAAWRGAVVTAPGIVRIAIDVTNLSEYALSAPVAAASTLAPAIVIWRTRALPRWLAGVALLEVAANIAELAGLAATNGTDAGGYAAGVGPVLWVVWAAALAITALAAKPGVAAELATPSGPPAVAAS
jgi:hypothetical protein